MKSILTLLSIVLITTGVFLLFFPLVSNLLYENQQSQIIRDYQTTITETNEKAAVEALEKARRYNEKLRRDASISADINATDDDYFQTMNHNGVIGYVEVPKIDLYLPFYHGVDEVTLETGIGHMPNSGFPLGEIGEHVLLGGHSGYANVLFTYLEELEIGDTFCLYMENKRMTYTVDDINIVLPSDTARLMPSEDHCYATLFTCYPTGGNSHRLLIRGELSEVETIEYQLYQKDNMPNVSMIGGIVLFVLILTAISFKIISGILKKRKEVKR